MVESSSFNKFSNNVYDSVDLTDCYSLLNVPINASRTEVRKAYIKLIRQHHTDHNPAADPARAQEITSAYEKINNHLTNTDEDSQTEQILQKEEDLLTTAEDLLKNFAALSLDNIIFDHSKLEAYLRFLLDFFKQNKSAINFDSCRYKQYYGASAIPSAMIKSILRLRYEAVTDYCEFLQRIISLPPNSSKMI